MVSRLLRLAVVPFAVAVLMGWWASVPAASSNPTVPSGWTTHTYDGLAVSMPASWRLFRQPPVCPGAARLGALLLGPVQGAGCPPPPGMKPPYVIAPNVVSVTGDSGTSSVLDGVHFEMVNGLRVRVQNQNALAWWIPGLDLSVSGSGPNASIVMHTIRRTTHLDVPRGWASHTYSGATISVPRSWTVEHNTNCPVATKSGALLLGFPKVLYHCPDYSGPLALVELYHPTGQSPHAKAGHLKVNGVPIEVQTASPSYIVWSVPSLGVDITAEGSEALQILHTLRRA